MSRLAWQSTVFAAHRGTTQTKKKEMQGSAAYETASVKAQIFAISTAFSSAHIDPTSGLIKTIRCPASGSICTKERAAVGPGPATPPTAPTSRRMLLPTAVEVCGLASIYAGSMQSVAAYHFQARQLRDAGGGGPWDWAFRDVKFDVRTGCASLDMAKQIVPPVDYHAPDRYEVRAGDEGAGDEDDALSSLQLSVLRGLAAGAVDVSWTVVLCAPYPKGSG